MAPPAVGFFEGKAGMRSMTRLILFILTGCEVLMVLATVFVAGWGAVHVKENASTLLAALTLANAPLIAGIWSTLREKRKNDEGTTDPVPPTPPQVVG